MPELRIPRAHSNEWYDHLATVQDGYYYPWRASVGAHNGEEAFDDLLEEHLKPGMDVLEVGCGHGDVALSLAAKAGSVVAYDRIAPWIARAEAARVAAAADNVSFLCHDALDPAHETVTLPVADNSIDLFVCRRGPLHWIADATRAARDGAIILHLAPMEEPIPAWTSKLPQRLHYENCGRHTGAGSIHQSVENRLHQAGLMLHSGWGFDVPESFDDPRELYKVVTWGLPSAEVEPYEDLSHRFDQIFTTYGEAGAVVLRHCRFLWKAVIRK